MSDSFSTSEPSMVRIVAGLGNIGRKYEHTRHNVGFDVLDALLKRFDGDATQKKFGARFTKIFQNGRQAILLWPETYMNESGRSISAALQFFKTPLSALLVVCDDLSLPVGKLRLRKNGSSGGQKGLKDTIERLESQEFPRLRIGIGGTPSNWETADYVLGKFSIDDRITIEIAIEKAADAVQCWLKDGIDSAMNNFNRE